MRESTLRVVTVHPDLLGTYGDSGNALVLVQRARWRGVPATLVEAPSGKPLPQGGDIYCLGGGEDAPQTRAAIDLRSGQALSSAVGSGAALLAVCAGFQLLGEAFAGPDGDLQQGLGILDMRTRRGSGRRAVGELMSKACGRLGLADDSRTLTGFENHAGRTDLGEGVEPLGEVLRGVGNAVGNGSAVAVDGAVAERVVGTYMHGPVLARNPALADILLGWVLGELGPIDAGIADNLTEETASLREFVLGAGGDRPAPAVGWGRIRRSRRLVRLALRTRGQAS
jgi:CobQ-like glutamine amidotransferase family enzyme